MDAQKLMVLFKSHSPEPDKFILKIEHAYTENISIATMIKSPDNVMPAFKHSHDSYEFIVPHTPIPFLIRDDATYFGEIGWIYPVPPLISHGIKYNTPDVSHTNIVFNKDYFNGFLLGRGTDEIVFNHIFRISNEMKMYISVFKQEFAKGEELNRHKLKHLSALICDELIDLAIANAELDERKSIQCYHNGIRNVAEYMNENYMKNLTIASLAKMVGLSTNYFSTAFLKMLGERPQVYLNKLRISKAKQLMENSEEPISIIAQKCGFNNISSFSTLFKRTTKQTPTEYRNTLKY